MSSSKLVAENIHGAKMSKNFFIQNKKGVKLFSSHNSLTMIKTTVGGCPKENLLYMNLLIQII